jgi:hypothetical protein
MRGVFTLDVRSLALMRIAVALTVLVDLCLRLVHLREHYSDDGVLPREAARSLSWLADTSILAISGSPIWAALVFASAIGLALAVLAGWRTRVTTLLLWLVVLAIQHRNPLVTDHRDVVFSCALLCGLLLPWGEAFSLDARHATRAGRYVGMPAALYIVQLIAIYLFAALLKTGPEWRSDFTAVELAVGARYWAMPAADVLLEHPALASVLTFAVFWFEALLVLLVLSPWRTRAARWLAVIGLVALQLGFAVFLWLDTFPMIAGAFALGLVPWPRGEMREVTVESSRPRDALAGVLVAYILALNVLSLGSSRDDIARGPAQLLGIDQQWTMFAPAPTRLDGWFVVQARMPDGAVIDRLTGRPATFERPASFREGIRTTRELVYMRRLLATDDLRRASFADAQCLDSGATAIAVYFVPVVAGQLNAPELLIEIECLTRPIRDLRG